MTALTDAQIVALGLQTMRRYRPWLGVRVSSRIAAARMARLLSRSAS